MCCVTFKPNFMVQIPKDVLELLKNKENESLIVKALFIHKRVELSKPNVFTYLNISKKELDISKESEIFRNMFPPNKKSSSQEVLMKLKKFLNVHTEYDMEDIIKAAKNYLQSLNDYTYCEKAGNFISKRMPDGVERSTLLEFLERGDSNSTTRTLGKTI